MTAVLKETTIVIAVLTALKLALEIVIARRAFLVEVGLAAMLDDFLHPPFFGLRGHVERLITVTPYIVDAVRDVLALSLSDISKVELEGGLQAAHDEQIGIAM